MLSAQPTRLHARVRECEAEQNSDDILTTCHDVVRIPSVMYGVVHVSLVSRFNRTERDLTMSVRPRRQVSIICYPPSLIPLPYLAQPPNRRHPASSCPDSSHLCVREAFAGNDIDVACWTLDVSLAMRAGADTVAYLGSDKREWMGQRAQPLPGVLMGEVSGREDTEGGSYVSGACPRRGRISGSRLLLREHGTRSPPCLRMTRELTADMRRW